MVLGQEIGMTTDLMQEQQEFIKPLLHHYFNGCYVDLDYNVPFLWKTAGKMLGVIALIIAIICGVVIRGRKKKK